MQIKISARHGHLNEETQERIRDKAGKLLHFFDRLTMIEVTVDVNYRDDHKDQKRVEIVVQAEHKHDIVAHAIHPDLMAATDQVVEKIEGQLRRYKEKIQGPRRRPPTGPAAGPAAPASPAEE